MQIDSKAYLLVSVPMFFVVAFSMYILDGFLRTDVTPFGIVSFEFIQTLDQASRALGAWGDAGRVAAGVSLGLDFLFIVLYVSIACVLLKIVATRMASFNGGFSGRVERCSIMVIGAGVFDVVENVALIQVVLGSHHDFWPLLAYWCAVFKFTVLGLTLGVAAFFVLKMLGPLSRP